jgi:hypothetical protein
MEATSEQIENLPKFFFFASPFCFEQSIENLHRSAPTTAFSAKKVHCYISCPGVDAGEIFSALCNEPV